MIPVNLSANCDCWIYDPKGSGIQILGIRSQGSIFRIHGHVCPGGCKMLFIFLFLRQVPMAWLRKPGKYGISTHGLTL